MTVRSSIAGISSSSRGIKGIHQKKDLKKAAEAQAHHFIKDMFAKIALVNGRQGAKGGIVTLSDAMLSMGKDKPELMREHLQRIFHLNGPDKVLVIKELVHLEERRLFNLERKGVHDRDAQVQVGL